MPYGPLYTASPSPTWQAPPSDDGGTPPGPRAAAGAPAGSGSRLASFTSSLQLPFKIPQIPSNRVYKALKRGTLGVGVLGPYEP